MTALASEQICAPIGLLKVLPNYRSLSQGHSGMRSKMDYVPTLTLSFPPSLPFSFAILSPPPQNPFYCFRSPSFLQVSVSLSPSLLFNGLHMSAKWPWHRRDKVKCPGARSHAVPFEGLDHSVLLTVHKPSPLPTHLSKPHYQDHPFIRRLLQPPFCNCRLLSAREGKQKKTDTLGLFRLEGLDIVHTTLTSK